MDEEKRNAPATNEIMLTSSRINTKDLKWHPQWKQQKQQQKMVNLFIAFAIQAARILLNVVRRIFRIIHFFIQVWNNRHENQ